MTRTMKWLGALALLVGAGYLGFQQYKIYLPGIIGEWREPIAENRPISWAQGPAVAPSGERPPNVILIVADDLGMRLPSKGLALPTAMPPMPPARRRAQP